VIANYYQKTEFCETPEPQNEEVYHSELRPCIWEDVKEKMNVTFTFEGYIQSDEIFFFAQFRKLTTFVLRTRIWKLMMGMGKTRQQCVNQFLSAVM
jgi:hypothetical protein